MKRCPTCDKTFEDSMRFCQVDGTSLEDDAPAFDPYATIVGAPAVVLPVDDAPPEVVPEPVIHETVGSEPIAAPEDVLDLPEADPLKTMYVSDAEMLATLGRDKPAVEPQIIEIPPIEEPPAAEKVIEEPPAKEPEVDVVPAPEPPSFSVPDVPPPSFQDFGPPPSPLTPVGAADEKPVPPPPIFVDPKPAPSPFNEAETMIQSGFSSPFDASPPEPVTPPKFDSPFEPPPAKKVAEPVAEWTPPPALDMGKSPFDPQPAAPVAAWTPPPAPEPSWQSKEVVTNTPVQPSPAAGGGGQSKGMAIGSLVAGILSCLCCPIASPVAIVTGFLARKKANESPSEYGGKGLALVGMITGVLGIIGQLILGILWLTGALDSIMTSIAREF